MINFQTWLNSELADRGWTAVDLMRSAQSAGYKISLNQISKVIKGVRQAGPDTCIAIAHGLGVPREEVFRARGWLLREPREVVPPSVSPKGAGLIREFAQLPLETQEIAADALLSPLRAMVRLTEVTSETPLRPPPKVRQLTGRIEAMAERYQDEEALEKALSLLGSQVEVLEVAASRR